MSLRGMFAEGQAYVALSRARSMEGLQVLDYAPGCVKVPPHPWSSQLNAA